MSDDLVKLGRAVERDLNNGFPMTCERGVIIQQMADRIEELEAKLAMAVETLQTIDDVIDARSELFTSDRDLRDNVQDRIRIALAELNGQNDET